MFHGCRLFHLIGDPDRVRYSDTLYPPHLLVTGGAGFIGGNFIRETLARELALYITNLDLLTYSGNLGSLTEVESRYGSAAERRYRFVHGDIRDSALLESLLTGITTDAAPPIDGLVHFAAESHVDRSILRPMAFVETNVQGIATLLEAVRHSLARTARPFRFVHISTDEVYGSLSPSAAAFSEDNPLLPNSPYAASKAASDMLVRSYFETYALPVIITRCSNNYGPYQYPEKLIPRMISRALADTPLPVYGDGLNIRDWIHVSDHCAAIWRVLSAGDPGAVYNIGGESEILNLDLVHRILALLDKPDDLIQFVTDRPGHDRRYAIDIRRIRDEFGWRPRITLEQGLAGTVAWYRDHTSWWQPLLGESSRATQALYSS